MKAFYLELLGAVVRWLLASISGYVVAHHVLTADQTDRLTTDVVNHALLLAPAAVALGWSVWAKYRSRIKLLTALAAPEGTDEARVDRWVKAGIGASLS